MTILNSLGKFLHPNRDGAHGRPQHLRILWINDFEVGAVVAYCLDGDVAEQGPDAHTATLNLLRTLLTHLRESPTPELETAFWARQAPEDIEKRYTEGVAVSARDKILTWVDEAGNDHEMGAEIRKALENLENVEVRLAA